MTQDRFICKLEIHLARQYGWSTKFIFKRSASDKRVGFVCVCVREGERGSQRERYKELVSVSVSERALLKK